MGSKILFTGGGTAGHVTVNLALIPKLQQEGWTCEYIGSYEGIEKQLITQLHDVPYYGISTGKLRRYLDIKNIKDPFRVIKGVMQAYRIIRKSKPDVVFSKGGFVSVPVILGAKLNRVPVVIHESDLTPGLANKIAMPFAKTLCVTFPETMNHVQKDKAVLVGGVIREELKNGSKMKGLHLCNFTQEKPVLLVMGGSQGARVINEKIRSLLDSLTERFQIVHICGKNQVDSTINNRAYKQFEYVHDELADLMAMTDVVISRAGSNSIFEFLALRKPMLLIPLSRNASRGDQILNADSFVKSGYAEAIQEEELTDERLLDALHHLYEHRGDYIERMDRSQGSSLEQLIEIIKRTMK